jgi:hypothetical protein
VDSTAFGAVPAGLPANALGMLEATVTTPSNGVKVKVYLVDVLIVGQHVDESLTFTSGDAPVPTAVMTSLITTIAGRIASV